MPWKPEPPAGHCLVCLGPVDDCVCLSRWLNNTIQTSLCVVSTVSALSALCNAVRVELKHLTIEAIVLMDDPCAQHMHVNNRFTR